MTDDAKKQYLIFAGIISAIITFPLVFILFPLASSPFFPGAVINFTDSGGLIGLIESVVNYVIVAGLLTPVIYFGLINIVNRA